VQRAIGRLTVDAAEALAREALAQTTASAIGDLLAVHVQRLCRPGAD